MSPLPLLWVTWTAATIETRGAEARTRLRVDDLGAEAANKRTNFPDSCMFHLTGCAAAGPVVIFFVVFVLTGLCVCVQATDARIEGARERESQLKKR